MTDENTGENYENVESVPSKAESDPFHPENVGTIQFIMLARIYDLLMVDLNSRDPERANMVAKLHNAGKILGPMPVFDGTFVFSEEEDTTAPAE